MCNNKKTRIMHIAQAAGGVDRYLKMLLKYLNKSKFENIVVASYDYDEKQFKEIADKFEYVDMNRKIGLNDLRAILNVRKLIKKYKPDIVYAHSSKAGAIARIADIGKNNICIYNPHGWAFNMLGSKKKQKFYSFLEKIMTPFCDKIVCISESEKKSALDKKICPNSKLQVIFNGVDVNAYNNRKGSQLSKKQLGISEDAFVVGMVGRISPQKAPDTFIYVAKKIKDIIPNSFFIIVGNGEQQDEIQKYADEQGFGSSLIITGWIDNSIDYIELFDVAVLLSRWEGFGLVLPEYMMVGKPIVATNVDAIKDIITDHKNGILVSCDNVDETYRAIMELYNDKELCENLVKQGKKDVQRKWDACRVSKEHEELFDKIMNK